MKLIIIKWKLYYDSAVKSYSLAQYLHKKIKPKGVVYFDTYVIHQAPVLSAYENGINRHMGVNTHILIPRIFALINTHR